MAAKFFVVLCASLALVNSIAACPCGAPAVSSWPAASIGGCGLGSGAGYGGVVPSFVASGNGGGLGVTSWSAIAPNGIRILSENAIEGLLEVNGAIPLLAAVAFEGNVPSSGAAGTSYSCGNGNVGISAESLAAAGLAAGNGLAGYGAGNIGLGAGNLGYGAGNIVGNAGLGWAGANAGRCGNY